MDFFTMLVFANLYFIGMLKFISDIGKLDNRFSNLFEKFSSKLIILSFLSLVFYSLNISRILLYIAYIFLVIQKIKEYIVKKI